MKEKEIEIQYNSLQLVTISNKNIEDIYDISILK